MKFRIGDRVEFVDNGNCFGRVVAVTKDGRTVWVQWDDGLNDWREQFNDGKGWSHPIVRRVTGK